MRRQSIGLFILPISAFTLADKSLEETIIYGRSQQQIGAAVTASQGMVGYDDIKLPPMLRVGELVEAIPGMVATQHSGTGKANQYFLRGFNLDHGTDLAATAGGIPINMRTHGHGQGYLDLNFLIPEMVQTTTYRKGPYYASSGDFSSAATVDFSFYERLPESIAQLVIGEHDYLRGLLAGSTALGGGTLTGALSATSYDGPWELEEDLEQLKFYSSYAVNVGESHWQLNLQGYDSEWDSSDQIPLRAVLDGRIDKEGFVDPDLGGKTERYALNASADFDDFTVNAWFIDYDFTLFSNFTYLLDDPVTTDQFEQRDERQVWGIDLNGHTHLHTRREPRLSWGINSRYDDIDEVGLYPTQARERKGVTRQDAVEELSVAGWLEMEVEWSQHLRTIFGVRGDYYDWDVSALREVNGGSGDDSLISPKLTVAYEFNGQLELYANWGRGFHSNDVRGATISVDPATGLPIDPVDVLVESEGAELGMRFEAGKTFNTSLVAFGLELDSELVFVGDAGGTEVNDGTRRYGVELALFWQAYEWLAINSEYTWVDARFKDNQGGGQEIPGAVESTFILGLNASWDNGLSASARLRYLSDAPLVEDNSVRSESSTLLNAGIGYRHGPISLRLDVFNALDSDDDDISYYYASRLPGEPLAGVEDIHFRPLEPRSVRLAVTLYR